MPVRPADPDDAIAVARIYIDSWNDGFGHLLGYREHDPERVERWRADLADPEVVWVVAERNGQVVGFVGTGASRDPVDPALGELHAIAVDPAHWRTGVGRALMTAARDDLGRRWRTAILWTPAGHDRGHAFYRATGWQALDRNRDEGRQVAFGRDV